MAIGVIAGMLRLLEQPDATEYIQDAQGRELFEAEDDGQVEHHPLRQLRLRVRPA